MHCELAPVTPEHIHHVGLRMRVGDVAEIWASHRLCPIEGLTLGAAQSVINYTGLVDGEPVCILGVTPSSLLTGQGSPWMLATPGLHSVERPFLRLSRPVIEHMQSLFPKLSNYVDNRNQRAIRWLRWLSFEVEDPVPYGPDRLPFCRFSRTV